MKIELKTVENVIESIPPLRIIDNPTIKGLDQNNNMVTRDIENYRIAGHEIMDNEGNMSFEPIRSMKSKRYNELAHPRSLQAVSDSLLNQGLQHGVWTNRFMKNYGLMRTDILLEKQYRINENVFEKDLGVSYNGGDVRNGDAGLYQPLVRLSNSFYASSKLQFGLVRIICANGMMNIAGMTSVSFHHLDVRAIRDFEEEAQKFLDSIFEEHYVENMIANFEGNEVTVETLLNWLTEKAGQRATAKAVDQFNLDSLSTMSINGWVATNIITWLTTHVVRNATKERRIYADMYELKLAA